MRRQILFRTYGPGDDCAHEMLPTYSPDGAIMLLPNAVTNQILNRDKYPFHFSDGAGRLILSNFLQGDISKTTELQEQTPATANPFHFSFLDGYWLLNLVQNPSPDSPYALCTMLSA